MGCSSATPRADQQLMTPESEAAHRAANRFPRQGTLLPEDEHHEGHPAQKEHASSQETRLSSGASSRFR